MKRRFKLLGTFAIWFASELAKETLDDVFCRYVMLDSRRRYFRRP